MKKKVFKNKVLKNKFLIKKVTPYLESIACRTKRFTPNNKTSMRNPFFYIKSENFYTEHQNFYTKLEIFYTKLIREIICEYLKHLS